MGVINTDPNRKVVPRWRSFTQTLWRGELLPVRRREPSKVTADKDFQDKIDAWNQRQTIVRASELVCSALVLGRNKEAVHAADYILRRKDIASAPLIEVSKRVVGIEPAIPPDAPIQQLRDQEIWYREINRIRNRLIREPRNAVLWVDLSRLYEILGCRERAERAIRIALALYPHNRFVLRSAVRLFVHQDRIRQAHRVLRRASSIAHDPWLIAVDIVLSSILSSPQIHAKRGRAMLSADIAPFHLSELSSALGTLEIEHGRLKRARPLIRQSLLDPTENAVAQAAWISRNIVPLEEVKTSNISTSFEASAWNELRNEKWKEAMFSGIRWLADQPFSSRPAAFGSFVALECFSDADKGLQIAGLGLRSNPENFTLLNNMAVAHALKGQLSESWSCFRRIRGQELDADERIVWNATAGLISFRDGDSTRGIMHYQRAIEDAQQNSRNELASRALAHYAIEATLADIPDARNLVLVRQRYLGSSFEWGGADGCPGVTVRRPFDEC